MKGILSREINNGFMFLLILMLNLNIQTESKDTIAKSFDFIAEELLHNWHLRVKNDLYSFTEIEFYFFLEIIHEDNATHKHLYNAGYWRFHSQGLDITFQGTDISDGGILIRGLRRDSAKDAGVKEYYVNGPRLIVTQIFKSLELIHSSKNTFGLQAKPMSTTEVIYKAKRHGLSAKQDNNYVDEFYRYYIDIDKWNISSSKKQIIKDVTFPLKAQASYD